jgi:hypothetical protein
MRFRSLLIAAAVPVTALFATPAAAQLVSAPDVESIAAVLRAKGYKAEITKDNQGDPMIRSGVEGMTFAVLFYGCTGGSKCQTIQFYSGFSKTKADEAKLNLWNREHRFGRAYIGKDGDPALAMDVDLDDGGLPRILFEDNVEFWTTVLSQFAKYVYQ